MKSLFIALLIILSTAIVYALYHWASFENDFTENYQKDPQKGLDFFQLNPQHVKHYREAVITLNPMEGGAPMVKPEIFGVLFPSHFSLKNGFRIANKRLEKTYALQVILQNATLAPGNYQFKNLLPSNIKNTTLTQIYSQPSVVFEFTQQHAKLVRKLSVNEQSYFFTLGIDPKRPYGDTTFYALDMADILSIKHNLNSHENTNQSDKRILTALHKLHDEMVPAMQVLLHHGKIKTGWYYRDGEFNTWKPVTNNTTLKFLKKQ